MSVLTNTDLRRILCYDENQWHEKPLLIEDGSDDCITPMGIGLTCSFHKNCLWCICISMPLRVQGFKSAAIV